MCRREALTVLTLAAVLGGAAPFRTHPAESEAHQLPSGLQATIETVEERGERKARIHCGSCHLKPPPSILPRRSWEFTLTWMGNLLGHRHLEFPFSILVHPEQVPPQRLISETDLEEIRRYYLAGAPTEPLPQGEKPPFGGLLHLFEPLEPRFEVQEPALVTLLKIDSEGGRVFVGDGRGGELRVFSPFGILRERHRTTSQPIALRLTGDGFYLSLIGDLDQDRGRGRIIRYQLDQDTYLLRDIVRGYHRIAHTLFHDLTGDGREDIVISAFGDFDRGRFAWLENRGEEGYHEHILVNRSGALQAAAHDFTGNGRPDLLALFAQGRNELVLFENLGEGNFRARTLVEKFPGFGYHSFELADFNGNGRLDVLTVNGNNMEMPDPPLRNYHGLRIYLNDGRGGFEEAFFYPMYGAIRAVVEDFTGNGEPDVAAVSYFPDWSEESPETFVFLENTGDLRFVRYSLPEASRGRWMALAAGDLDGDGRPDLLLGNGFTLSGISEVDKERLLKLVDSSLGVLVLRNRGNP